MHLINTGSGRYFFIKLLIHFHRQKPVLQMLSTNSVLTVKRYICSADFARSLMYKSGIPINTAAANKNGSHSSKYFIHPNTSLSFSEILCTVIVLCSIIRSSTVCSNASLLSTACKADSIAIRNITSTAPTTTPAILLPLLTSCLFVLSVYTAYYTCANTIPMIVPFTSFNDTALKAAQSD